MPTLSPEISSRFAPAARDGVIHARYEGVLVAPPTQRPSPFSVSFETPVCVSCEQQVIAAVAVRATILGEYRGFIAHA